MISSPLELDFERLPIVTITLARDGDVPELLGNERLNAVVLVDDETESGELTRTIADELLITEFWNADLQGLCQKPGKRSTNTEIQLGACFNSFRLVLVEVACLPTCLVYLAERQLWKG